MSIIPNTFLRAMGNFIGHSPWIQREVKRGLTIFNFHDVTDCPSCFTTEFGLYVTPDVFRYQCQWVKSNYNVVHPIDILNLATLPEHAAVISFDDGFLGSFENGLDILKELSLPAILFLNMDAIINEKPIISAVACYLEKYVSEFTNFAIANHLKRPFHLSLTPSILIEYERNFGKISEPIVIDYQGPFASLSLLKSWDNSHLFVFGNHLFNHWNAAALDSAEFERIYQENDAALSCLKNSLNFFAFTNGQPGSCFSPRDLASLSGLGSARVFSSAGTTNCNYAGEYLLDRLSFSNSDKDTAALWSHVARSALKGRIAKYKR
jgi:peptidoglycan/xylan/chitin deacetylase (PgdA/CDA1 family)